jgi:hypothetical protein
MTNKETRGDDMKDLFTLFVKETVVLILDSSSRGLISFVKNENRIKGVDQRFKKANEALVQIREKIEAENIPGWKNKGDGYGKL